MIGLIEKPLLWFLAIIIGVAVSTVLVIVLKSLGHRASDEELEAEMGDTSLPGRRTATA